MKTKKTILSVMMMVICVSISLAISVDPDAFADGTDISNAFTGVTLSSVYASSDGKVYARANILASTGLNFFGHSDYNDEWFDRPNNAHCPALKAVFDSPVMSVSIDAIANDDNDYGILKAYSSSDILLDTYNTNLLTPTGDAETMIISRGSADIAYIIAGGNYGVNSTVHLDNLNYCVPEPATIAILSLGGLVAIRRRKN
jgi:hypothetical protein